jgi:hypothetical protein
MALIRAPVKEIGGEKQTHYQMFINKREIEGNGLICYVNILRYAED